MTLGSLHGLPSVKEFVRDSSTLSSLSVLLFAWEIFKESPKRSTIYNFDSKGTSFTMYFLLSVKESNEANDKQNKEVETQKRC